MDLRPPVTRPCDWRSRPGVDWRRHRLAQHVSAELARASAQRLWADYAWKRTAGIGGRKWMTLRFRRRVAAAGVGQQLPAAAAGVGLQLPVAAAGVGPRRSAGAAGVGPRRSAGAAVAQRWRPADADGRARFAQPAMRAAVDRSGGRGPGAAPAPADGRPEDGAHKSRLQNPDRLGRANRPGRARADRRSNIYRRRPEVPHAPERLPLQRILGRPARRSLPDVAPDRRRT